MIIQVSFAELKQQIALAKRKLLSGYQVLFDRIYSNTFVDHSIVQPRFVGDFDAPIEMVLPTQALTYFVQLRSGLPSRSCRLR